MDDSMTFWCISDSSFCATCKSSYKSLMKVLNRTGASIYPGYKCSYCPPTRLYTADHHSLGPAIQAALNSPRSPLIQPTYHRPASDALTEDTVSLLVDWVGNITASCSSTRPVTYSKFITNV